MSQDANPGILIWDTGAPSSILTTERNPAPREGDFLTPLTERGHAVVGVVHSALSLLLHCFMGASYVFMHKLYSIIAF